MTIQALYMVSNSNCNVVVRMKGQMLYIYNRLRGRVVKGVGHLDHV